MGEQTAFFDGVSPKPQRSGVRTRVHATVPPSPDYATPAAVSARCYEGAGTTPPPGGSLGDEFQRAVRLARERMADPAWGAPA